MATVYLAEDLKHHRKVVAKALRPELAATLGPDRFLRWRPGSRIRLISREDALPEYRTEDRILNIEQEVMSLNGA